MWRRGACVVKGRGIHGEGGVHGEGGACVVKGAMHGIREIRRYDQ